MATLNINNFKSNFLGGARPTLYSVQQSFPISISSGSASRKLEYLCKGAVLPGDEIGTIEVPYMGRKIKVAGDKNFNNITLTIINDIDFEIRTAYERWMTLYNTHEGNIGAVNANDYWSDMIITQLGRDGSSLKTYRLVSAFPVNIGEITLGYDSVDTIEEFTLEIAYQYWQNESVA